MVEVPRRAPVNYSRHRLRAPGREPRRCAASGGSDMSTATYNCPSSAAGSTSMSWFACPAAPSRGSDGRRAGPQRAAHTLSKRSDCAESQPRPPGEPLAFHDLDDEPSPHDVRPPRRRNTVWFSASAPWRVHPGSFVDPGGLPRDSRVHPAPADGRRWTEEARWANQHSRSARRACPPGLLHRVGRGLFGTDCGDAGH